jgi:exodeoxyribonuclease VII small subunit
MPKKSDYKSLNAELDEILVQLQAENLDVDQAVELYERGIEITKELETYLKEAENKVEKIKADLS